MQYALRLSILSFIEHPRSNPLPKIPNSRILCPMPESNAPLSSYLALGVGILSLGFSALFIRWADAPGLVSSFYRMAIGAAVMTWPFYRQAKTTPALPRQGVWLAVLGGLFFAADMAFWSTGVMLGGVTNPTLLANTAPLWVGLGALVFFREKPNPRFWIGLLIAMMGTAVILGLDSLRAASFGMGSLFGLLAAFFYGGFFLFAQKSRQSLSQLAFFWISTASSALGLLALSLVFHLPLTGYTPRVYLLFIVMGIFVQALGWMAVNYAQGHLPASLVAPTMLGQPAVTAALAWLLLDETLSGWQAMGGATVLAGVLLVHRSRQET